MIKIHILHCNANLIVKLYDILKDYNVHLSISYSLQYGLAHFIRNRDVDIAIIEADLIRCDYDGIYIAQRIKIINRQTLVIFISNDCSYDRLLRIINTEPFAFVNYQNLLIEFSAALNRAISIIKRERFLFTYQKRTEENTISLMNVIYFCSMHRTVQYICINNDTDSFYKKLDYVEKVVEQITNSFVRVNQSYLINTKYIVSFDSNKIEMINGELISIGRKYHKCLEKIKETQNS